MRFTKEEAENFEKILIKRGYRKFIQHYKHEDYLYWKSFERKVDEEGEKTEGYSVGFAFYDWSKYPQHTDRKCISVALEFVLGQELGVDRLDISVSDDKMTMEEFEDFSKKFYDFYLTLNIKK